MATIHVINSTTTEPDAWHGNGEIAFDNSFVEAMWECMRRRQALAGQKPQVQVLSFPAK